MRAPSELRSNVVPQCLYGETKNIHGLSALSTLRKPVLWQRTWSLHEHTVTMVAPPVVDVAPGGADAQCTVGGAVEFLSKYTRDRESMSAKDQCCWLRLGVTFGF